MGDLISDNFDRADGPLGANWTTLSGHANPQIVSNLVQPGAVGGASSEAAYTGAGWPDNQYAYVTAVTLNTGVSRIGGLILRATPASPTYYLAFWQGPFGASAKLTVHKYIVGAQTIIFATATKTLNSGQIVKFEAIDSTLRVYYDGVDQTGAISDSSIGSGSPGLYVFLSAGVVTDVQIDNWVGGGDATPITGLGQKHMGFNYARPYL